MRALIAPFAFICVSAVGCRQMQVDARLKEYSNALDPELGRATKADVVRQLGMPERCEPAAGHEFCRFRTSYGQQANAQAYGSTAAASSHEVFDQVDAEFDQKGTFISWRANVQR